ncbi:cadherin repeat domain-containing protein, partial [Vogesella facilis]
TVVGVTAFASDGDATTNSVSYSLSDNAGGRFAIDASSGVVTVAGALDRETADHYDITVRTTSADGSTADKTFTIALNDVNEFTVSTPADSDAATNAVDENSSVGTAVGVTAFAQDNDATTNAVSYSLSDSAGGRFAIDASTGLVTVAGALDRETADHYDITVLATSADGSSNSQSFTISVGNVNDNPVVGPSDSNAAANLVLENAAIGATVGLTAFASDADAGGQAISYSLSDNAGGRFAINSTTGVVTVAGALDYETASSHSITVLATSADGSSNSQSFTIDVGNVNDNPVVGPSDSNAAANLVLENAAIGSTVGLTAFASDADAGGQAITYSLSDNAGGRFAINSTTGVVTVAGALDYETASSHSITVLATSADGSSNSQSF